MTWFKVDDGFWSHPKVVGLSDEALALWLRAALWSCAQLTDGHVPVGALRMLRGDAADELVEHGLWEPEASGYVFHDWHDWQPSVQDVQMRREKRAAAGRAGGVASGRSRRKAKSKHLLDDYLNENEANANPVPVPVPTEQVSETSPVGEGVRGSAPRKRGCRIPDPFVVTADMRRWASSEVGAVDVDASTRAFVDHWRAESGQRAAKRDWTAAWRNWLRRDADHARPRAPAQTPTQRALATAQAGARVQAELDASTRKAIA